jgi:hypothetical protein
MWSGYLQVFPERVMYKVVRVKPKKQWRSQEVRDVSKIVEEFCQGKPQALCSVRSIKRPCQLQTAQNMGGTAQAHWKSSHSFTCPRCQTWI